MSTAAPYYADESKGAMVNRIGQSVLSTRPANPHSAGPQFLKFFF